MKFNSKSGQELRTWILFFVGIALAVMFALKETPLNPWWTLVIGAFTCTAVIVSAVQSVIGGMSDAARKALDEARKAEDGSRKSDNVNHGSEKTSEPTLSVKVGNSSNCLVQRIRWTYAVAVQSHKPRRIVPG